MNDPALLIARLRRAAQATAARAVAEGEDGRSGLGLGLERGRLHEVYAAERDDAAAAAGFAVASALAIGAGGAGAMPLVWLRTEAGEREGGRLHATGLIELGLSPERVVMVLAADEAVLLRAAADAARCAGLGAIVVEGWGAMRGLDLTATRRLVLAAEASGVTILSLRIAAEPVASAAATRWRIAAVPSVALEAGAPGRPAFEVECLRRRGGPPAAPRRVEWNRETRTFEPIPEESPLAGAGLPLAADRAAAERSPAPLRRTG